MTGSPDTSLTIDTHHHILPDFFWRETNDSHAPVGGLAPLQWSKEAMISFMDDAGIDVAVMSVSTPGVHLGDSEKARSLARRCNEFAAELVHARPDRFASFACIPLPDTTEGIVNADIKAEVTGYLLRQDYKEGSLVKKGQLLFELDPRPFEAAVDQADGQVAQFQGQLEQAISQVAQAEAQVAQANSQLLQSQAQLAQAQANQVKTQLDVNKYAPLAEQKAVTQQDLDNAVQGNIVAKAQVEAARAGVETARAQLRAATAQIGTAKAAINTAKGQIENAQAAVRTAQLNLGFTRIISPIDGIAGIAQGQVGNLITTTSAPLTTVSTVDPIKIYFTLSEQQYLYLNKAGLINARSGASVAQIELELILADGSTFPRKGNFYFADRQVDQKTGAIRLAGIFPNPDNVLRPGQYGRVRALTTTKNDALLVPQRAVTELQGIYQVAVVGADNKVEIRTVKVGDRTGSNWIIEDGLKAGDSVIVEGLQEVRPGVMVNPKTLVKG